MQINSKVATLYVIVSHIFLTVEYVVLMNILFFLILKIEYFSWPCNIHEFREQQDL